jgi:cell division septum initiation protein DivIVA
MQARGKGDFAMASSEVNDTGSREPVPGPANSDPRGPQQGGRRPQGDSVAGRSIKHRVVGAAERDRIVKQAREASFPIGLRGYDRTAVDRYVERVTRLITELEMSSSPESAVRHALEEVSEETRELLQRAYETADDITARARSKADERVRQAQSEVQEMLDAARHQARETREAADHDAQKLRKTAEAEAQTVRETAQREADALRGTTTREVAELREAASRDSQQTREAAHLEGEKTRFSARREADEMVQSAESRTRDLARNAEAILQERRRLIDDVRAVGEQLVALGEVEGKRFARLGRGLSMEIDDTGDPEAGSVEQPATTPESGAQPG